MITFKYNDKDIEIPHKLDELTIKQFDEINEIIDTEDSETIIINYINLLSHLSGLSIEEIEELDYSDFIKICTNLFREIPKDVTRIYEFEVQDVKITDNFNDKLTIRQSNAIEKIISDKEPYKFSRILGYIYDCNPEVMKVQPLKPFIMTILDYNLLFTNYMKNLITNYEAEPVNGDITIK